MSANWLKIFVSQLNKSRLLALINVSGLAAGLTCCILIALFVEHEMRYDAFFRNADAIHRLTFELAIPDNPIALSSVPGPLGPLLEDLSPDVRMATRLLTTNARLQAGEALFREENFDVVDKNFFTVFDLEWLSGDAAQAFAVPNAVVLTETSASQYFADVDPLGATLLMDDDVLLTVTGVVADLPSNTHLTGRAFASFDLLELMESPGASLDEWWGSTFYTYVVLEPGASISRLETLLAEVFEQYTDLPPWAPPGTTAALGVMPITDIHMKSRNLDELRPGGSPVVVYAFSAIGIAILAIAVVNFINITTAWASRRAREVGVRKVLGATREELVQQFCVEALLLCGLAMTLALACVELLLPSLNALLDTDLQLNLRSSGTISVLTLVTLALGALAGWYPSLYLSAFRPVAVLKGQVAASERSVALRGMLVVFQFAIVIVLMVAVAVIQLQLRHADSIDLGFQRENILLVNATDADMDSQYAAFRDVLLQSPAVVSVASSDASPLRDINQSLSTFSPQGDPVPRGVAMMSVSDDYFDAYSIRLLAGRVFSSEFTADFLQGGGMGVGSGAVVINAAAAREFGWTPAEAVEKAVQSSIGVEYPVVGVVADTVESAKLPAQPILYFRPDSVMAGGQIAIRVAAGGAAEALRHTRASWTQFGPAEPIRFSFLDATIAALYQQDTMQFRLAALFSVLTIIIACMGLYGLVAFSTECRTKEIGIRKVMGGSVWSIVLLFTGELSRLVLISNIVAWPLAFIVMDRWLESFAYRIDLTPMVFIGSGLIALCIAWVTVGGTAAKAASAKPVLALRYE